MSVSQHHSFDIHLAEKYGVKEAIIIHHFQHWIQININNKINERDGRTWTYQTLEYIADHFPYWSKSEVFEIIDRLCQGKGRRSKKDELEFAPVLMKGNFNKNAYDRTVWYAFVSQERFTILAQAKKAFGSSQNGDKLKPTPIPDTKTDSKTYTAGAACVKLLESLQKVNSKFIPPKDLSTWQPAINEILLATGITEDEICKVIDWAFSQDDPYWRKLLTNTIILKNHWNKLWMCMNEKTPEQVEEESKNAVAKRVENNRKWVHNFLDKASDPIRKKVIISDNVVWLNGNPVGFSEPAFREIIEKFVP